MDFESYLKVGAQQIEQELEQILSDLLDDVKKNKPRLLPLALGFINSCRGGKRIRGVLVKLGYELGRKATGDRQQATGKEQLEILRIGAALEILHSAILIHDDVIDQSPTRRNQPSLYQALGGDHYGISQAISLGDVGLLLPFKIIADSKFPGEVKTQAISLLAETIANTAWGEALDVDLSRSDKVSEEDRKLLYTLKTARYTVSGPLQLGAILGGAESHLGGVPSTSLRATVRGEEWLRSLTEFGENLGIAFQIQDDILDGEVDWAGGVDLAKQEAIKYKDQAMKVIPELTNDKKMSKLLEQMGEYLIERIK